MNIILTIVLIAIAMYTMLCVAVVTFVMKLVKNGNEKDSSFKFPVYEEDKILSTLNKCGVRLLNSEEELKEAKPHLNELPIGDKTHGFHCVGDDEIYILEWRLKSKEEIPELVAHELLHHVQYNNYIPKPVSVFVNPFNNHQYIAEVDAYSMCITHCCKGSLDTVTTIFKAAHVLCHDYGFIKTVFGMNYALAVKHLACRVGYFRRNQELFKPLFNYKVK